MPKKKKIEKQKELEDFFRDDENEIKYLEINGVRVVFLAYTRWTNGLSMTTSPLAS